MGRPRHSGHPYLRGSWQSGSLAPRRAPAADCPKTARFEGQANRHLIGDLMRLILAALALSIATSAAAQTASPLVGPPSPTAVSPDIVHASHALAAMWR